MATKKGRTQQKKTTSDIEIRKLFQFFDKNNDGCVSKNELEKGLRWDGNNPTQKEIDDLLREMNYKEGQMIDFEQFKGCVQKYYDSEDLGPEAESERLDKAFKVFDKNGDGSINKTELKYVLTQIGDKLTTEEVESLFREADVNKNGKIDFAEFKKMFLKDIRG